MLLIALAFFGVCAKDLEQNQIKSNENQVYSFVSYLVVSTLSAGYTSCMKVAAVWARNKIFT